jgi:hypothetical protein
MAGLAPTHKYKILKRKTPDNFIGGPFFLVAPGGIFPRLTTVFFVPLAVGRLGDIASVYIVLAIDG